MKRSAFLLCALVAVANAFLESLEDIVPETIINPVNRIGDKVWQTVNDNVPDALNPLNLLYTNSCIEDLGCFYTGPPFFHPIQRPISLPPTSRISEIKFHLFTPTSPNDTYELDSTLDSLLNSTFNPKLKTKILTHGFLTELDYEDIRYGMKDEFMKLGKYNIIIADWTAINGPPYAQAVANTRVVGAKVAKLIHFILNNTDMLPEDFHVVGHSLGGHVAGYAGERIENLGRITGLDPAGPYFHEMDPEVRLDITDALFVDVIHTDGAEFIIGGLGTSAPIGHMDFYPNGGRLQAGCVYTSSKDNIVGAAVNFTTQFVSSGCDHNRASEYFLESINNKDCRFLSVLCDSYDDYEKGNCPPENSTVAEMGLHNKPIQGLEAPAKFFLRTRPEFPFCLEESIYL